MAVKKPTPLADDSTEKWWVRIYLPSSESVQDLLNTDGVELFRATVRRIDNRNVIIEGYINKRVYKTLESRYRMRILGDVAELLKSARGYISSVNRYLKDSGE